MAHSRRNAAPDHDSDGHPRGGAGICTGPQPDEGRYLSGPRHPGHLCRSTLRRHGPGADGRVSRELLRVPLPVYPGNRPCGVALDPRCRLDEAALSRRDRHGDGHGRDRSAGQSLALVHAARNGAALHHALRRRKRACGLLGLLERDPKRGRDRRLGVVPGPSDVLAARGCLGPSAFRGQRPQFGRPGRPRQAAFVQHLS